MIAIEIEVKGEGGGSEGEERGMDELPLFFQVYACEPKIIQCLSSCEWR